MQRAEAIDKLQRHEAQLKRLGVTHLYLFGSTGLGRAHERSDVDLFFDYDRGTFGFFALMEVKETARNILGCPTDIMTRDSLHPVLRRRIEDHAHRVF